jgi:hypothetical protein
MAKKGKEQQKHVASKHVTTRRLARWQQEKRRQRITFLSGIVIIVIVLGIIVGGIATTRSSEWLSKVQTDSDTVVLKKADYLESLKLIRNSLNTSDTNANEQPLLFIENNLLIEEGAKAAKLTVSEAEVTDTIRAMFETDNESISDADFQQRYQNMLNSIGVSDSDYRKAVLDGLLNQELLQYYIDQIPESGEQVTVERIIVFNESAANEVTQKWREGETFETLSEQYGNLSDSGWIIKGTMEEEFDNVAFSIDIGNISDPIPSTTGYYIIKVLDRTDGPITEEMRQQTGLADYNKWFSQAYAAKVERNPKLDLTEVYAWAIKQLS